MNTKTKQGGLGIVSILTIVFIVLKLSGVIKWHWIWVLSPIWISALTAAIAYLRKMNDELKIPHCIKNYGADSYPTENGFVPENVFLERLPEIAKNAIADACTGSNPRIPTQEEMEKLLKCCYYDTEVDF